mgnify:CR=1 FL=1
MERLPALCCKSGALRGAFKNVSRSRYIIVNSLELHKCCRSPVAKVNISALDLTAHAEWQHPFVNIFKLCDVDTMREFETKGDVTEHIVRAGLACPCTRWPLVGALCPLLADTCSAYPVHRTKSSARRCSKSGA